MRCLFREIIGSLQTQLHLTRNGECVSQIRGVAVLEIEISVVAEEVGDTGTLCIKSWNGEGIACTDHGLVHGRADQTIGSFREVHIVDTINSEQMIHLHRIADLSFLGVPTRDGVVGDGAAEIAVFAQYRLCHGGTQGGIHPTHQHGLFTERLRHPLGKAALLVVESIPYP